MVCKKVCKKNLPGTPVGKRGGRRAGKSRPGRACRASARRLSGRLALALGLLLLAAPAGAACYADYKAKRDNPLRLHYGVIELPEAACRDRARARAEIARRLAEGRWTLLRVLGQFGPEGLDGRRESAGEFFLRF